MQRVVLTTTSIEPSDSDLRTLMHDVATEAKRKATIVKKQLSESVAAEIQKARLKYHTLKV